MCVEPVFLHCHYIKPRNMTREEFQELYKKFQQGKCTSEEIERLHAWEDGIRLLDDLWEEDLGDEKEVKQRITDRLAQSMAMTASSESASRRRPRVFRFISGIAATALIATVLFFLLHRTHPAGGLPIAATDIPASDIKPGGNKAYLTIAGGKTIVLNDAQVGNIAQQDGIQISKTKDGQVIYQFNPSTVSSNTAIEYNTITTPRGGQYQLILADGTRVWLNAASSVQFPVAFKGKERRVILQGEAYFEIAKNASQPFYVQAGNTNVQVLGTDFNVSAYSDDESVVTTLLNGSVRLIKGTTAALLTPGQQGIAVNTQTSFQVQQADLKQVMAWKDNYFLFKNTDIRTIMKQMSRWYDVDFVYEGTPKDQIFGGKISKYKDISELLRNLELTGTIHFKIQGRRIIVM